VSVRSALGGIALLGVSVLLTAGALEAALRLGIVANERQARLSPDGGGRNVPHRILVLGDSFMANKHSIDLHDNLLNQLGREQVGMVNTARAGDGPRQYLDALHMAGSRFRPDVVLLCYYVGNDLTDVGCNEAPVLEDHRPVPQRLAARAYLYDFVRRRWGYWRARTMDFSDLPEQGVDPTLITAAKRLEVNPWLLKMRRENPDFLLQTLLAEDACARSAWARTEDVLEAILNTTRQRGATLLAVTFPHTLQVNDAKRPFYEQLGFAWDDRISTARAPQRLLEHWYTAHDVPHLDLLPEFLSEGEELYLEHDEHLNWAGETLAANRIASFVAAHLH